MSPGSANKPSETTANKPKDSKKKKKHESNDAISNAKPQDASNVGYIQTSEEPERCPEFLSFRPEKRPSTRSNKINNDENSDIRSGVTRNNRLKAVEIKSLNHRKTEIIESTSMTQIYSINTSASKAIEYFSSFNLKTIIIIILSVCLVAFAVPYRITDKNDKQQVDIDPIKERFPKQESQFWKSIVSGLNLTIQSQQPTSYIFLYESEAEQTIKKLLVEISKYAVFQLTESTKPAINFTEEIIENSIDYGSVLSHLKGKLETNGLMIIENIEKVPEEYALAFHSICDEVSPLVGKSAFFFTIKVDKLEQSPLFDGRIVHKIIRENWPKMEEDIFVPLFTRLSGMILRVYPNVTLMSNLEDS